MENHTIGLMMGIVDKGIAIPNSGKDLIYLDKLYERVITFDMDGNRRLKYIAVDMSFSESVSMISTAFEYLSHSEVDELIAIAKKRTLSMTQLFKAAVFMVSDIATNGIFTTSRVIDENMNMVDLPMQAKAVFNDPVEISCISQEMFNPGDPRIVFSISARIRIVSLPGPLPGDNLSVKIAEIKDDMILWS